MGASYTTNQNGFSLVELLLASAIGVILFTFMASSLARQSKQTLLLEKRLVLVDFKNAFRDILSVGNTCSCQLNRLDPANPNSAKIKKKLEFNGSVNGGVNIGLESVFQECGVGSSPLVKKGESLWNDPVLLVSDVRLENIKQVSGDIYDAEWVIEFGMQNGFYSRQVRQHQAFRTTPVPGNPTNRTIASCLESGSSGDFLGEVSGSFNVATDASAPNSATVDLSLHPDAKFMHTESLCRCTSSSGGSSATTSFAMNDGSTLSFQACVTSEKSKPSSSSLLPIPANADSFSLSVTSNCGGATTMFVRLLN